MKDFIEYEDPYADLNEIGQQGSLKFCFAKLQDDKYVGQHVFVKCRDFLNDVVIACDGGYTTPTIYGFRFDGENNMIDTDKTRLVLMTRTDAEHNHFKSNLSKLNNMIHSAGMERCRTWEVNNTSKGPQDGMHYFVVEGDKRWAKHVTAMSFYSLLLRTATSCEIPSSISFAEYLSKRDYHSHNDWEYLSEFNKAFPHPARFIKHMELLSMETVHMSITECDEMEHAHERGGIMVFAQLIRRLRNNSIIDWLEDELCWYDEIDLDDDRICIQFPTFRDAQQFV